MKDRGGPRQRDGDGFGPAGPERGGAPDPADDSGIDVVLRALLALNKRLRLEPHVATDAERLADFLLDHAREFSGPELLYLLTELLVTRFDALARVACDRAYLFLNPNGIAEECVIRTMAGAFEGTRKRPFSKWKHQIVAAMIERGRSEPHLAPFQTDGASTAERISMAVLADHVNRLDLQVRRIVWLAWVEHRNPAAIAESTGVPLERVEWILASIAEKAKQDMRAIVEGRIAPPWERPQTPPKKNSSKKRKRKEDGDANA